MDMAELLLVQSQRATVGNPIGGIVLLAAVVIVLLSKSKLKGLFYVVLTWVTTGFLVHLIGTSWDLAPAAVSMASSRLIPLVGLLVAIAYKRQVDKKALRGPAATPPPEQSKGAGA